MLLNNARVPVTFASVIQYNVTVKAPASVRPTGELRSPTLSVKTVAFCSYIERFNCTLRQRVSRLVRKTLSFSKKLENHIDSFGLSGALTTPGNGDFLRFNNSASISLDPSRTSFDTSFGETKEFANASVRGDFSRTFDSLTSLTLSRS